MIDDALAEALRRCARSSVLLVAADYDGTLSPIVPDPSQAVPHDPALDALVALASRAHVHAVIISGRSRAVLEALTGAPDAVTLVGTHGAEVSGAPRDPEVEAAVAGLIAALRSVAENFDGTLLEPKPAGAALHYRHAADPAAASAAARTVGADLGARVIDGKQVVELLIGEGDKGTAIEQMRERWSASSVVFFGDDTTDEDVFATLRAADVGVKVGEGETRARYRVDDPAGVAEALSVLLGALS